MGHNRSRGAVAKLRCHSHAWLPGPHNLSDGSMAGAPSFGLQAWGTWHLHHALLHHRSDMPDLFLECFVVGHPQAVTSLHAYWSWSFFCRAGVGMKRR